MIRGRTGWGNLYGSQTTRANGGHGDLFSDHPEPPAYVSPSRWGKLSKVFLFYASSKEYASTTSRARAPSPIRQRPNLVSASLGTIATATKHKDVGSAKFMLGRYRIRRGHVRIHPRSRDPPSGAPPTRVPPLQPCHRPTQDRRPRWCDRGCWGVIEHIGARYHLAREAKAERAEEGAGVELGDVFVKALKKRAEAWEGREKWEVLARMEWAGEKVREEAARGAVRCRRMAAQEGRGIQGVRVEEILGVGVDMMDLERKQNPPRGCWLE
ncbi:hypothetical protein FPV67DRAFT_1764343 [Lyophyllum atratum]|nr:hypothetical protein FPV67DRAFT_1764343 [Lyophyllum atratum]